MCYAWTSRIDVRTPIFCLYTYYCRIFKQFLLLLLILLCLPSDNIAQMPFQSKPNTLNHQQQYYRVFLIHFSASRSPTSIPNIISFWLYILFLTNVLSPGHRPHSSGFSLPPPSGLAVPQCYSLHPCTRLEIATWVVTEMIWKRRSLQSTRQENSLTQHERRIIYCRVCGYFVAVGCCCVFFFFVTQSACWL